MATFKGGQSVKGGYFLCMPEWKLEMVEAPFGVLPGDERTTYRRVPVPLMLVLAPLFGLAFVMLLPFLGLAVVGEMILRKVRRGVGGSEPAARPTTAPPR